MPNPQFTKPWHGVPRDQIQWNPSILEDTCIGCGTCVTGCSRLVYRFDFERKKPVVVDPMNCMVGCTTCANTCPANAIVFPPLETVLNLERLPTVRHAVEDDLLARREMLGAISTLPHPDRIVKLAVTSISHATPNILQVVLSPTTKGECFCEFMPGQYIELWHPGSDYLSRSYSIANAPHSDGGVVLHIQRVEGGRLTAWMFDGMAIGDHLQARGPLGAFTMRSLVSTPLLFIAGGTGLAPVLALIEQQIAFAPQRDMVLLWGTRSTADFYALDKLRDMVSSAPELRIYLVSEQPSDSVIAGVRVSVTRGTVLDVLTHNAMLFEGRDIYIAGPPGMLRGVSRALSGWGVGSQRIHIDSFGV